MLRVYAILVSTALLAACGQKGPLYMPVIPAGPAPAAATPAMTPAPAATTTISLPNQPASAPPVTGTASPIRTP